MFAVISFIHFQFLCSWCLPSLFWLSHRHLTLHPSPWPLPVLFDINIALGWPDGVGFRCGTAASSALLLPGYKQVSCGPWWPISVAHMLIEKLRQSWFLLPALYSVLCGKWAVKTLTSRLCWNSKHAVVSGVGATIVNTLFSFFGLTWHFVFENIPH